MKLSEVLLFCFNNIALPKSAKALWEISEKLVGLN